MPSPVASRVNRVRFRVGQAEAALREVVERLAEVVAEVRGEVR
jgi:hypothetical protein